MKSIKLTFTRAVTGMTGFSIFWLMIFAVAIDDDRQRREKKQREKRNRLAIPPRKPKPPGC